jgi:S1-C subfamily serine protease
MIVRFEVRLFAIVAGGATWLSAAVCLLLLCGWTCAAHGQTASFEAPAERLAAATVTVFQVPTVTERRNADSESTNLTVADPKAAAPPNKNAPNKNPADIAAATAVSLGDGLLVAAFKPSARCSLRLALAGGEQTDAVVSVVDENTSLVLLASDRQDLPRVKLARETPKVGGHLLAASAWGSEKPAVSLGILAARDRFLPQSTLPPLLQCDVRVTSAATGAGVVNADGDLVGLIVAADYADRGGWTYALEASHVQRLIDAHRAKPSAGEVVVLPRRRAFAGLDLRQELRGGPLVVRAVVSDGPAAVAGLRAGDEVRQIAGRPTQTAVEALAVLMSHQPQDRVEFAIRRDGQDQSAVLTLGVAKTLPAVVARKIAKANGELVPTRARATEAAPRASEPGGAPAETALAKPVAADVAVTGDGAQREPATRTMKLIGAQLAAIARLEQSLKDRDARIDRLEAEIRELRRQSGAPLAAGKAEVAKSEVSSPAAPSPAAPSPAVPSLPTKR